MLSKKQLDELTKTVINGIDTEILADHLQLVKRDLRSLYNRNYVNDTMVDC